MTTDWFDAVKTELLAQNPFRGSEYFRRFSSGALAREQAWGHISQWYFLICWFPRMFSGIHSRCDQLEVRKDCARHLLVEDLGFFRGQIGGTPDHVELYQRIGDDMGYLRDAWERATPIPEMNATTPPILPVFNVLQEINSERHLLAAEIRDGRGCRKPTNSDRLASVPNIGQM